MKSKTDAQRRHAKQRAAERYDLFLNRHEMADIVRQITTGQATFVEKQSNRVSLFRVNVADKTPVVVYDRHRKTIVTFLPEPGALNLNT